MTSPDRLNTMRDAVVDGNLAKVRLLLKAGVPPDGDDIMRFPCIAASLCHEEVFSCLVEHGASLASPELLTHAVDGGGGRLRPSTMIVSRLLAQNQYDQETLSDALRFACVSGNPDVVQMLIDAGADPNSVDSQTQYFPLSNAVEEGHLEVVQTLLSNSADPTVQVAIEDDLGDLTGETCSLKERAESLGHTEIAALLPS